MPKNNGNNVANNTDNEDLDLSYNSALDESEMLDDELLTSNGSLLLFNYLEQDYLTFRKKYKTDADMHAALKEELEKVMLYNEEWNSDTVKPDKAERKKDLLKNQTGIQSEVHNDAFDTMVEKYVNNVQHAIDVEKINGEKLFKDLKSAKMKVERNIYKNTACKTFVDENNVFDKLVGEHTIFDGMLELLDSGDKFYRGSSNAYKEIKKQISDLKYDIEKMHGKFVNNQEDIKFIELGFKAINEKVKQYLDDRKDVAWACAKDSYKGKRIDIMNNIAGILSAKINSFDHKIMYSINDTGRDFSKKYEDRIIKAFEKNSFNATLYTEYRACKMLKDTKTAKRLNKLYKYADKNSNDRVINTLKEAFKGEKVDIKTADHYAKKISKIIDNYEKGEISFNDATLKKIIDKNSTGRNLEYLDEMIFENHTDIARGAITGDSNVDRELAKTLLDMSKNKPVVENNIQNSLNVVNQ